ncbi:MAG: DUF11 domain-containing protein, partial [Actinomycetia bacterium]|nr:DUF11 domain-containing protein [Actinomycetes bacterium]
GADLDLSDNSATDTTPIGTGSGPDLSITKSDSGVTGNAGDTISYKLGVANGGNQHASGVQISETVPPDTTFVAAQSDPRWTCSSPAAGSACTLDLGNVFAGPGVESVFFAVAIDSPLPAGVSLITNTAFVADDGSGRADLDPTDNISTDTTPISGSGTGPDLAITKSDGGITVNPADTIVYAISVENLGNQDAAAIQVAETVPENSTFLPAASDPRWSCVSISAGSSCTLDLGPLPAGGTPEIIAFTVRVDAPIGAGVAEILNTASVDAAGDLDLSNNTSSTTTPLDLTGGTGPDLSITKSDSGVTAGAGDIVAYKLGIANTGNQEASGVRITETVPANTTFSAVQSDPRWSCTSPAAGSICTLDLGDVAAAPGVESVFFAATVDSPLPAGVSLITNTATVADDGAGGADLDLSNNSASDTTPISSVGTGPDLILTKSDGGATVGAGGL